MIIYGLFHIISFSSVACLLYTYFLIISFMEKTDFYAKALKILEKGYVCDHCLGRQFAQLLSGMESSGRGRTVRDFIAMLIDSGEAAEVDASNFPYKFRFSGLKGVGGECKVCGNLFENLDLFVKKTENLLKGLEFSNFLVGTRVSRSLLKKEEELWESVGIDWCEPIKAEINRLVGKRLEKSTGKIVEFAKPEILIILDIAGKSVKIDVNSLYIYGEYNKLIRTIPQTRWPSGKYKNSVEQIVAKPVLKQTMGSGSRFHGAGREDIDARCLAWRPFILEITGPKKRKLNLRDITKVVNKSKKVEVRKLRFAGLEEVEVLKSIRPDKTYKVTVVTEEDVKPENLKRLTLLKGKRIYQETPTRVMHRRADKLRKREIKDIKWKKLGKKKLELVVRTEAGTYVKELVSGDKGRTYPSVAETLGTKASVKELDVVKIHRRKA